MELEYGAPGLKGAIPVTTTTPLPVTMTTGGTGTPSGTNANPTYTASAGSTGTDYSSNKPTPPNVGAATYSSVLTGNVSWVLLETIPAGTTAKPRFSTRIMPLSGQRILLIFDDGVATTGNAPQNWTPWLLDPGQAYAQGGSDNSDGTEQGRISVYGISGAVAAIRGNFQS